MALTSVCLRTVVDEEECPNEILQEVELPDEEDFFYD
jgi:hypothetical protein